MRKPIAIAMATTSAFLSVPISSNLLRAETPVSANATFVMKTAGQPDRVLKVLSFKKYPDGDSLAQVQDVKTGHTFMMPGKVVQMQLQSHPAPAETKPESTSTPYPTTVTSQLRNEAVVTNPTERIPTRTDMPASGLKTGSYIANQPPMVLQKPMPTPPVQVVPESKAVVESRDPVAGVEKKVVVTPPPVETPNVAVAQPVQQQVVSQPVAAVSVKPAPVTPTPTEAPKIAVAQPLQQQVVSQPVAAVSVKSAPAAPRQGFGTPITAISSPNPMSLMTYDWKAVGFNQNPNDRWKALDPTATTTVTQVVHHSRGHDAWQADSNIRPVVSLERTNVTTALKPGVEVQVREATQGLIYDLVTCQRPSERETAASKLKECQYHNRPEVMQALLRAAVADPAPSVRAHCIDCLSALGYTDSDYRDHLQIVSTQGPSLVRTAAKEALSRWK